MVKTAVIPIAGQGSRMLPATKVIAKELLPVFDRPVIQHVVEEVFAAGIEELIFVSRPEKRSVIEHFLPDNDLVDALCSNGKLDLARRVADCSVPAEAMKTVYQHRPLGLGHAVLQALPLLDDAPFAVVLPDEVYLGDHASACLPMEELVHYHQRVGGHVLGTIRVADEEISKYGVAELGAHSLGGGYRLSGMVEKPEADKAPSDHALIGRYILDASILPHLLRTRVGHGGEIQLTDAIASSLCKSDEGPATSAHALEVSAERFDCGDRLGWVRAQSAFAVASSRRSHDNLHLNATQLRTRAQAVRGRGF